MGQGGQSSQGAQGSHGGQPVGVWVSVVVVVLVSVVRVGGHEVGGTPGTKVVLVSVVVAVVVSVVVFPGTVFVEVLVTAGGCPGAEVVVVSVLVVVQVSVDGSAGGKVVVNICGGRVDVSVHVVSQLMVVAHEAWRSDAPSLAAATLSARATPAIKGPKNWDGMTNPEIQ